MIKIKQHNHNFQAIHKGNAHMKGSDYNLQGQYSQRRNLDNRHSEITLYQHIQLQQKTLLTKPYSSYAQRNQYNKVTPLNFRLSLHQSQRSTARPGTACQQIKKIEVNNNILRAWKEVDSALMRQKTSKTLPFKVVRSLSVHTLKKKAQVEEKRKAMLRCHQYNPFGSPLIDSEYLD